MERKFDTYVENKYGVKFLPYGQVQFDLWAPDAKTVDLCFERTVIPMQKNEDGWFSLVCRDLTAGTKYMYRIDVGLLVPDPASRCQETDVHGWSLLVNGDYYDWEEDKSWKGLPWNETVLYELHVGTYTPQGTFKGVMEKLDYLASLGITAIELMPVADFPGKRNWGYDGVLLFAPDRSYGTPDELKDLIKAAHKKGIMVILDVVYNHFGCDGNYLYCYAKSGFFESKHITPWGNAINFENRNVRDFYIQNTLYWLEEYHFDGIRFDAVHEIKDNSHINILVEIAETVKERIKNRQVHLVLENDDNNVDLLGFYRAQWNDDFHHCMHIHLTGETGGYYKDYTPEYSGKTPTYFLARSLTEGFAYQGEPSAYRANLPRGQNSTALDVYKFVNFIQNHDQVGNRVFGERIAALTDKETLKTAVKLYLLSPMIPMLFMGEEWGCKTPFMFFCDLDKSLAQAIINGRRQEFSGFPEFANPLNREKMPNPTAENTFKSSILNWDDVDNDMLDYYKELLMLRKKYITPLIPHIQHSKTQFEVLSEGHFRVNWFTDECKTLSIIADFNKKFIEWAINNG